jgi:hypothetical protein
VLKRLLIAIAFAAAFAYIESAVVVYLRVIFHPNGFTFPLAPFADTELGRRMLTVEVGREAATLVLIVTSALLFARARQEATAYFLIAFAVWDVFYYVWLKMLIGWPASLMDWDILFLIPLPWASAVLYPVLVSLAMFIFGVAILHRTSRGRPLAVRPSDWLGWLAASIILVVSFCLPGPHMTQPDYAAYFHWWIYAAGLALGIVTFWRAFCRPAPRY